jgi:hypothetical protein
MRTFMRAAAAALALSTLAGCDTRRETSGLDDSPPEITQLSIEATNDSVDINAPMKVTVEAFDNLSLQRIVIVVDGVRRDSIVFNAATPYINHTFDVPLAGIQSGSVINVHAEAIDGAGNGTQTVNLTVTAYDLNAPVVVVTAPAASTVYRAGDPTTITVTATDSSGIARIGYQIIQVSGTGAVDTIQSDSADVAGAPITATRTFNTTIPVSLAPGSYMIRGFARDVSFNGGLGAQMVSITVLDPFKPGLDFISPAPDSNITVGNTILAEVHLTDNVGIGRLSIIGISTSGDPDLGVVDTVIRYDSVFAPVNVGGQPRQFRAGLTDTTIRRLMAPKNTSDSTTGPLYLIARVTDNAGNDSTVIRTVRLVSGPTVHVLRPASGTQATAGKSVIVEVRGTDRDGVRVLGYNVTGVFTATRQAPVPPTITDTLFFVDTLLIPPGTPAGTFTIVPFATDNLGQPGSGTGVTVVVQAAGADTEGPTVTQVVRTRLEADDSVLVTANDPSGISYVGFQLNLESDGSLIRRDSVAFTGNNIEEAPALPLNLPAQYVGQKIVVVAFAYDVSGNIGYSAPAGTTTPPTTVAGADPDTTTIVYGRTFSLPQGGLAGDIAVDVLRNRVYVSNLTFDRLEVWEQSSQAFASKKVAVGSDPWGLFIDNSGDTLLVANSGGTNISRVSINHASVNSVAEVPLRRIKTPNSYIADITVSIDDAGNARFEIEYFDYSDRPQYVAQAINGDIYYSTKPTSAAPDGTIRRYQASGAFPDVQQIWQYGLYEGNDHVAVINADSVMVIGGISASDTDELIICDHAENQNPVTTAVCVQGTDPQLLANDLRTLYGADVVAVRNLDVPSLGLTDTTFVAAGGNRQWIAFGEGATDGVGRVMMVQNPGNFFSPSILVSDYVNNASDKVFGLAINQNSSSAGVHGDQSHFFEIQNPFHLRLQGSAATFSQGAGIAFHPNHIGDLTPTSERVAFVASANGTIEIIDTFHYINRGTLPVRASLYGPIRVTLPMPGDDPAVVLKLFGLTTEGLIVIDIRASDILPLP